MSGRPNWYYNHPPACTCAGCRNGTRERERPGSRRSAGQLNPNLDAIRQRFQQGETSAPAASDAVIGGVRPAQSWKNDREPVAPANPSPVRWLLRRLGLSRS